MNLVMVTTREVYTRDHIRQASALRRHLRTGTDMDMGLTAPLTTSFRFLSPLL